MPAGYEVVFKEGGDFSSLSDFSSKEIVAFEFSQKASEYLRFYFSFAGINSNEKSDELSNVGLYLIFKIKIIRKKRGAYE